MVDVRVCEPSVRMCAAVFHGLLNLLNKFTSLIDSLETVFILRYASRAWVPCLFANISARPLLTENCFQSQLPTFTYTVYLENIDRRKIIGARFLELIPYVPITATNYPIFKIPIIKYLICATHMQIEWKAKSRVKVSETLG